jgi:hypothetical protein
MTDVMVAEYKAAFKMDVTRGVCVIFHEVGLDSYYVRAEPLSEVIAHPKVEEKSSRTDIERRLKE